MKFGKEQIDFMKSLNIECDFENPAEDDLPKIEASVAEELQTHGFDKDYEATAIGIMCESILDKLNGF